jgi:YidC/Oxa1 family membrane protein insertase
MMSFFNTILTQPILNLLLWLYDVIPGRDIGISIIALTIIIKLLLYPLAKKQIKQQKMLQDLQPKIDELRKKYKDDKETQARELMALYQAEKVNPASSCLPLLIQLPIFIALLHVLQSVLGTQDFSMLYSFVPRPSAIQLTLFNGIPLDKPNIPMAIIAGIVQFWQARQMIARGGAKQPPKDVQKTEGAKDESMAAMMNKQMMYVMPIMTILIGVTLPGGLTLYWLTMSLLTVAQQWYMLERKGGAAAEALIIKDEMKHDQMAHPLPQGSTPPTVVSEQSGTPSNEEKPNG